MSSTIEWTVLPFLFTYLRHTSWISIGQFMLLAAIVFIVLDRASRKAKLYEPALNEDEPICHALTQNMAQLNVGIGLLLTFSGVYGLIGSADSNDGHWSLLMALGSSALGYSAYAACSFGLVLDSLLERRQVKNPTETN